jgi:minimal CRISPR polymerase domain
MKVIVIADGDKVGDLIGSFLLQEDLEKAKKISKAISYAIEQISHKIIENDFELYYAGGDDFCFGIEGEKFNLDNFLKFMKECNQIFYIKTGCTISYGFGTSAKEAIWDLNKIKTAKNSKVRFVN